MKQSINLVGKVDGFMKKEQKYRLSRRSSRVHEKGTNYGLSRQGSRVHEKGTNY